MKIPALHFSLMFTMGCVCSGLLVGPVRLPQNKRYIDYQLGITPDNSILECPYSLKDDTERVSYVTWFLWDNDQKVGSLKSSPTSPSEETGLLRGKVNLHRQDGALELTALSYNLAGHYSCAVNLTNGVYQETEKWEVLIIDKTSQHPWSNYRSNKTACQFERSYRAYPIFPPPTIHAGIYSALLGGYYDEVKDTEWMQAVNPNKSVAFSYNKRIFTIDEFTPLDAKFLTVVAVYKTDGTYIALDSETVTSDLWSERGCPRVKLRENQRVNYNNTSTTCRGEHMPLFGTTGTALVSCERGYRADGQVQVVLLDCYPGNFTWRANNATMGELKCVDGAAMCLVSVPLLLMAALLSGLLQ